jgi:Ras association (RalGDS/AF-6) domain
MRFYFQDAGQKVATKCIRVSSTATTQAVIETLIEKFRPDMRMLEVCAVFYFFPLQKIYFGLITNQTPAFYRA